MPPYVPCLYASLKWLAPNVLGIIAHCTSPSQISRLFLPCSTLRGECEDMINGGLVDKKLTQVPHRMNDKRHLACRRRIDTLRWSPSMPCRRPVIGVIIVK
jgi:hypothetical protein